VIRNRYLADRRLTRLITTRKWSEAELACAVRQKLAEVQAITGRNEIERGTHEPEG
jgi:hypothetical protein